MIGQQSKKKINQLDMKKRILPNSTMWVILFPSGPSEHEYSPASEGRASDKTSSDPAKKDI